MPLFSAGESTYSTRKPCAAYAPSSWRTAGTTVWQCGQSEKKKTISVGCPCAGAREIADGKRRPLCSAGSASAGAGRPVSRCAPPAGGADRRTATLSATAASTSTHAVPISSCCGLRGGAIACCHERILSPRPMPARLSGSLTPTVNGDYTALVPCTPCRRGGTVYAAVSKTAPGHGLWVRIPPPAPWPNSLEFGNHDDCPATFGRAVDDPDDDLTPTVTPTGARVVLCPYARRLTASPGESIATTASEIRHAWPFVVADFAASRRSRTHPA